MTVFIPSTQWFTVVQWMLQNYITANDYTHIKIGDMQAITFVHTAVYARFYRQWQHIILADND
jgi:hypothetical protein